MIVQRDFLNKLRDFGLNTYEGKLWAALLSRGISTAGELSDIANVPRSRTYDVLESLEKKGFIIMKIGKPIKYIAVPPEEVLERVKKQLKQEADEKGALLEELRESKILNELTLLHNQGIELVEPTDISGSFRGRGNIYNQVETMIKNATKSVILMTTEEGLIRKFDVFEKVIRRAKEKGVKIRIAAPITKKSMKIAKELSQYAEVKQTASKGRFCLVDSKELMFMLIDDKEVHSSYDVGIWVNTHLFSNLISDLFDSQWNKMKTINVSKS